MPSWEVHGIIAEMLGFDRASSKIVDELIDDKSYVHDLGRKTPKLSLKMEFFDPESFLKVSDSLKSKLSKLATYPDLFYLHHALDLLSLRMASAILIGCDIKSKKDCVMTGVEFDLKGLYNNIKKVVEGRLHSTIIPIYKGKELMERLRSNFEKIVDLPEFLDWVKMNLVDPRIEEEKVELDQAVKSLYDELYKRKERWTPVSYLAVPPTLKSLPVSAEVVSDDKTRYFIGSLFQGINKLAARRSRLFDYVFVCKPYSLSTISENLLRSNRGLGKEVRDAIVHGYEPERIKEIVSRNWIISELNEMPSTIIDTYVELILKAVHFIEEQT